MRVDKQEENSGAGHDGPYVADLHSITQEQVADICKLCCDMLSKCVTDPRRSQPVQQIPLTAVQCVCGTSKPVNGCT